mgnify:CR=1 FL=1
MGGGDINAIRYEMQKSEMHNRDHCRRCRPMPSMWNDRHRNRIHPRFGYDGNFGNESISSGRFRFTEWCGIHGNEEWPAHHHGGNSINSGDGIQRQDHSRDRGYHRIAEGGSSGGWKYPPSFIYIQICLWCWLYNTIMVSLCMDVCIRCFTNNMGGRTCWMKTIHGT